MAARLEEAFKRLVEASGERIGVDKFLRSVSIACADGALASNGPAGRAQNNALGVWWRTRRGPDHPRREIIDLFHLVNTSGEKAFKSSSQVLSFFAMLKQLEHCLGIGHGRHIDRSVAAWLGETHRVCKSPAGSLLLDLCNLLSVDLLLLRRENESRVARPWR